MKTKNTKCNHYWSYANTVWSDGKDGVAIGRYCSNCGKMETSIARNWHTLPKGYADMREALQEAMSK